MLGRVERELLLGQLEGSFRMLAGELELAAMDGDERDGKVVLRHLEPVLDRDVVGASGVRGRERPAPFPELDPGEAPERAGAARLVALAPLPVLALEQGAGLVPPGRRREGVDDGQRRLLHQLLAADGGRKVVRARRKILRRFRVAGEPAEDRLHRSSARSEHVVVEAIGELERCTGMLERSHVALPEACRPREPTVDDRLKRRARGRLAQGFLEQRDGTVDALELGEEDESLGAQRADFRLGQQVGRDRPGARPLPGSVMRTSRSQRAPMALVAHVQRRQPERLLGELGRDGRRAAIAGQSRGVVEHNGNLGVRRVPGQREVARTEERVFDDSRDAFVNALPLLAQVLVEDRRQQRVGEANRPVLALDHVRGDCRVERVCRNARPLQERL